MKGKGMLHSKTILQRRKKNVFEKINAKVISCEQDLSGKLVEHLRLLNLEDKEKDGLKELSQRNMESETI